MGDNELYKLFRSKYTGKQIEEKLAQLATITSQLTQILQTLHQIGVTDASQESSLTDLATLVAKAKETNDTQDKAISDIRALLPQSIQFSNYTQEELERKAHSYELQPAPGTIFCLDDRQTGIGSNSCGPALNGRYAMPAQFCFTFSIVPLTFD